MKAIISLKWAMTFYTGMTLISCEDYYYQNSMNGSWQPDIPSSYGKTRLTPESYVNHAIGTKHRIQYQADAIPKTVYKYEALPRNEFPSWVTIILGRDIFSESNPLAYLLRKTVELPYRVIETLNSDVKLYLLRNKFPPHYVPYAKMLSTILNCQPDLHNLREVIINTRHIVKSSPSDFTLPAKFATSELSAVFSPDVFLDRNPPAVIFNKIVELPENAVSDLISQLENISLYGGLPRQYTLYANALKSFMQNRAALKALNEYNSEMKNAS